MTQPGPDASTQPQCRGCGRPAGGLLCADCDHLARTALLPLTGAAPDTAGYDPAVYEELARLEPTSFWFRGRSRILAWALATYFPDAATFFDVGCGTGFTLATAAAALPPDGLAGGDMHQQGLRIARRRVPQARLFQLDAEDLPFDREFDVVGAFDVLEHITDDRRAIGALAAAVRPGGGVLITVPQHRWLWSPADDAARHVRRYTREELVEKVVSAGLDIIRVTSFMTLLLPVMVAVRKRAAASSADFDFRKEFELPRPVDRAFEALVAAELGLIRRGVSFGAGGSLLAVAGRPA